jgi:hypothetical protein
VPYVADLFADADTLAIAAGARRVAGDVASGFEEAALLGALDLLAAAMPRPPIGIVYGAGFEDRPDLLRRIAARWPLLGNTPGTVEAMKDPWRFADVLGQLGIPHPQIAPAMGGLPPSGWLVKRRGGAGGGHILHGQDGAVAALPSPMGRGWRVAPGEGIQRISRSSLPPLPMGEGAIASYEPASFYRQRQVAGRAVSALFLASAEGTQIIGFSDQWTAPAPGEPFRFGGAAYPADISPAIAGDLAGAVHELTPAFGLRGLNSADFIVGPEGWWLLEINPRLGATLDIFETAGGALFAAHLAAVSGGAPGCVEAPAGARALQLAYAPRPIPSAPLFDWPPWCADRPPAGTVIPAQAPCCTVLASADTPCEARRLCVERVNQVLKLMGVEECRRAS